MQKKAFFALVLCLLFITSAQAADEKWQRPYSGLNELDFNCIVAHPKQAGSLFAGSLRSLYRSSDSGKNWKAVLNPKKAINAILIDEAAGDIYAATESGLYRSSDDGLSWKLIYRGRDKFKNILDLAQNKGDLFLGTEAGLLVGRRGENNFQKADGGFPQSKILSLCVNASALYLVTKQGVFKSADSAVTFQRIFTAGQEEPEEIPDEYDSDREEEEFQPAAKVKSVVLDKNDPETVYLGTDRGVLRSLDAGKTWQALTKIGLGDKEINYILIADGRLYAAGQKGVYAYDDQRTVWNEIYQGAPSAKIKYLAYDYSGASLWAASDKGLFNIVKDKLRNDYTQGGEDYFSHEPSINTVQGLAIEYADVEPEKISRWKKQARLKALLPKLSVGWDKSTGNTYEIYTSSTSNYCVNGPADINSGWDVTVSWELSDLIWSSDQTSVDTRSRLTTQLRNDILDEVTRAYFERRRLQVELLTAALDGKKRADKELRIQELTANLDAFTGGRFSQLTDKNNKRKN